MLQLKSKYEQENCIMYTPIQAALHWLPIPIRSDPKVLMMPYKSVKSLALILLLYIIQWVVLSLNESLNLSVTVCLSY